MEKKKKKKKEMRGIRAGRSLNGGYFFFAALNTLPECLFCSVIVLTNACARIQRNGVTSMDQPPCCLH